MPKSDAPQSRPSGPVTTYRLEEDDSSTSEPCPPRWRPYRSGLSSVAAILQVSSARKAHDRLRAHDHAIRIVREGDGREMEIDWSTPQGQLIPVEG